MFTFSGLGEGVTFPVMHAMLANWSPPLELSRLNTFVYTGSTLGTIISMPLTGIICDYLGWEAAFYIFGSCGIVWFIFWAFLVYETPETLVNIININYTIIAFRLFEEIILDSFRTGTFKNVYLFNFLQTVLYSWVFSFIMMSVTWWKLLDFHQIINIIIKEKAQL